MYTDNNKDNDFNTEYDDSFNANSNYENNDLDVDENFYGGEEQSNNNEVNDDKPGKSKKVIIIVIIILFILLCIGGLIFFLMKNNDNDNTDNGVTEQPVLTPNLLLSMSNLNLNAGDSKKIEYTIENDNGTVEIIWSSSDESVVTVDQNGNVKGVKAGNATISASYSIDGQEYKKTCEVTVIKKQSSGDSGSSGTVDKTKPVLNYTITSGKENDWTNGDVTIKVTATDSSGSVTVKYTTNCNTNCKYTKVTNNTIKISNVGSTVVRIIATDKASNSVEKKVTVKIDKTNPTCSLKVSETGTLSATYSDTGGSDVSYYGFDSGYSGTSINSKQITGAGSYLYYVKDKAGNTNSCSLVVKSKAQYRYRDCASCKTCSVDDREGMFQSFASCAKCGCATWGNWSNWFDGNINSISAMREVETRNYYYTGTDSGANTNTNTDTNNNYVNGSDFSGNTGSSSNNSGNGFFGNITGSSDNSSNNSSNESSFSNSKNTSRVQ